MAKNETSKTTWTGLSSRWRTERLRPSCWVKTQMPSVHAVVVHSYKNSSRKPTKEAKMEAWVHLRQSRWISYQCRLDLTTRVEQSHSMRGLVTLSMMMPNQAVAPYANSVCRRKEELTKTWMSCQMGLSEMMWVRAQWLAQTNLSAKEEAAKWMLQWPLSMAVNGVRLEW